MTHANALHGTLIRLEVDGQWAPDFRRLVRDHRMRLGIALRRNNAELIAETRAAALELLDLWRFDANGDDLDARSGVAPKVTS